MAPNGVVQHGETDKKAQKKTRGQLKRLKAKAKKAASGTESEATTDFETDSEREEADQAAAKIKEESVAPSLVDEILQETSEAADQNDPQYSIFKDIFDKFKVELIETPEGDQDNAPKKPDIIYSDEDASSEGSDNEAPAASKRKARKASRLSVAELKRIVKRPELVEWVDVSAPDPRLLLSIKSYRNVVPIPQHWSAKRDYLQSKRGLEKPPFQLPSYIADTGIATQRDAVKEKEDSQSLKQKTRERVQPKMGKIDIDYQKLHDAFFKYQTPPRMTSFGEMYYEGKEFETDLRNKRPGELSKELIEALSIPPLAPPPWLIAMQRYGAPPSYPHLKIPGLNAPIPHGASWGFHPGGWGAPMMDEFNRPVYPAVLGTEEEITTAPVEMGEPVVREQWASIVDEYEEAEDDEEEEEEEEPAEPAEDVDMSGTQTGLVTPSGAASVSSTVPGGLETPDFLELRKQRAGTESVQQGPPRQLYQVVDERKGDHRGFLGSERQYDLSGVTPSGPVLGQEERRGKRKQGDVDLALDPSELEGMTEQQLRDKYEASRRSTGGAGQGSREDFGEFVAAEVAKRRKRAETKGKDREREKFKF